MAFVKQGAVVVTAIALAVVMLVSSGCGRSSNSSRASGPDTTISSSTTAAVKTTTLPAVTVNVASGVPLSRNRWIAKGNAICARLSTELRAVHVKKAAELARVLPQEAAYERAAVVQLAKLVPPVIKAHDWQRLVNATAAWAEGSAMMAKYAYLGEAIATAPIFAAVRAAHERMTIVAARDGLRTCSVL